MGNDPDIKITTLTIVAFILVTIFLSSCVTLTPSDQLQITLNQMGALLSTMEAWTQAHDEDRASQEAYEKVVAAYDYWSPIYMDKLEKNYTFLRDAQKQLLLNYRLRMESL